MTVVLSVKVIQTILTAWLTCSVRSRVIFRSIFCGLWRFYMTEMRRRCSIFTAQVTNSPWVCSVPVDSVAIRHNLRRWFQAQHRHPQADQHKIKHLHLRHFWKFQSQPPSIQRSGDEELRDRSGFPWISHAWNFLASNDVSFIANKSKQSCTTAV